MPALADASSFPAPGTPEVRRITTADLRWALAEGWRDFRDKRGDLIFAGALYPAICIVAIIAATNEQLLPLFFPLVAGVSIAGPAVASGFYELARRREAGEDPSWWHFLDPLRGRSRGPLIVLTLGLGLLFLAWLAAAYLIYAATFGAEGSMQVADFGGRLFATRSGWALIIVGNLVGAVFAVVALVTSVVSFPMAVDQPVDAGTALCTSLRAAGANPGPVLGWGARVAGLLLLGAIPAGIGLAVVLPWLGYATWHLYTRLVVR